MSSHFSELKVFRRSSEGGRRYLTCCSEFLDSGFDSHRHESLIVVAETIGLLRPALDSDSKSLTASVSRSPLVVNVFQIK